MNKTNKNKSTALIIDDDIELQSLYENILSRESIEQVIHCTEEHKVVDFIDKYPIKLIILDITKTTLPGIEMLTAIKLLHPEIPVIIATSENKVEIAVECLKREAFDYILKPFDTKKMQSTVAGAVSYADTEVKSEIEVLRSEIEFLRNIKQFPQLKNRKDFSDIITNNPYMFAVFSYCESISKTWNSVFITGKTGTGKELIARSIHKSSNRAGKFVACNIAGFDDQMLSDALFGHIKGAFTGAVSNRKGLVDKAEGGTLFLDEIGDLSLVSQVKLLRLLQENEYSPLGSDEVKKAKTQVIVATNCNIKDLCSKKLFRNDLYYRLITHSINLPALKDRKEDIPLLLDYFLNVSADKLNLKVPTYHSSLIQILQLYDFPGNIRELKSMVEDAVVNHTSKMLSGKIFRKHIEQNTQDINFEKISQTDAEYFISEIDPLPHIKEFTDIIIHEAMKRTKNNQTLAAKMLGISHQALNRRLKNIIDSDKNQQAEE
jgi:DNA-binding NtrC family response regulator